MYLVLSEGRLPALRLVFFTYFTWNVRGFGAAVGFGVAVSFGVTVSFGVAVGTGVAVGVKSSVLVCALMEKQYGPLCVPTSFQME